VAGKRVTVCYACGHWSGNDQSQSDRRAHDVVDYLIVGGAWHLCRDDGRFDNNRRRLIDEIGQAEAEDEAEPERQREKHGSMCVCVSVCFLLSVDSVPAAVIRHGTLAFV